MLWSRCALLVVGPLIVVVVATATPRALAESCPQMCECSQRADDELHVRCERGGLDDAAFYRLLEATPKTATSLRIAAPEHRPNSFRWSDNLNAFNRLQHLALINANMPALSLSIQLPALVSLNLRGNAIESLQLQSFRRLPALQVLDVSHNRLVALPSGAFIYLRALRSLSLAHNNFSELPTSLLRGPTAIESLELDGARLSTTALNALFVDVRSLRRLELNFCGLGDTRVGELRLDRLPELQRLGLAGNGLSIVPSAAFRALPRLETLDLDHNEIRTLEPCAFCACNISRVFLSHNLLGVSAGAIAREAFAETTIRELDLAYNLFDDFGATSLGYATTSVETLDLSGNTLREVTPRLTEGLDSLRDLHLADNQLIKLPDQWPAEYSRLRLLNLSRNAIDRLPGDEFDAVFDSLVTLDVSHNELTSLSDLTVERFFDRLHRVFLNDNPWDCRCAVQNLQAFMLRHYEARNELHYETTQCARPDLLRGQSLHRVQHINECAVLFGASYGITQTHELVLLLCAVVSAAGAIAAIVSGLLYIGHARRRARETTKNKREFATSRLRLPPLAATATTLDGLAIGSTNRNGGHSLNSSLLSEPLTTSASASITSSAHDLPPPLIPNAALLSVY